MSQGFELSQFAAILNQVLDHLAVHETDYHLTDTRS
jgi:hypothetical protein